MRSIGWVIDDDGSAWEWASVALAKRLRTRRTPQNLLPFLIGNMGWIAIRRKRSVAILRFDADIVAHNALVGCMYWLHEHGVSGIAIEQPNELRPVASLMNLEAAIEFLGACSDKRRIQSAFKRKRLKLSETAFAHRIAATREVFNVVHQTTTRAAILKELFGGLFTAVSRLDCATGEYIIDSVGSPRHEVDQRFTTTMRVRSFSDIPDRDYGRWIAESYREAREADEPIADDIEAKVYLSGNHGRLLRYSRLLVPVTTGSGERFMLTASTHFG